MPDEAPSIDTDPVGRVSAHGVGRRFGAVEALRDVSCVVPGGAVTVLVGPNGSGKTTLLRLLSGRLAPSSGEVVLFGIRRGAAASPLQADFRRRMSYVSQHPELDPDMTGGETLELFAALSLYGGTVSKVERRRRIGGATETFSLGELLRRPIHTYSGGQRRRLHVAASLLHDPELLLLDEPSAGLDKGGRQVLWQELRRRAEAGASVVLVSHDREAVRQMANHVVILERGVLAAQGRPQDLTSELDGALESSSGPRGDGVARRPGGGHGPGMGRGRGR